MRGLPYDSFHALSFDYSDVKFEKDSAQNESQRPQTYFDASILFFNSFNCGRRFEKEKGVGQRLRIERSAPYE